MHIYFQKLLLVGLAIGLFVPFAALAEGGQAPQRGGRVADDLPAEHYIDAMLRSFASQPIQGQKRHSSFVPRDHVEALAAVPVLDPELPSSAPTKQKIEKTRRFIDAWKNKPSPEEKQARIAEAMAVPTDDSLTSKGLKSVTYSGLLPVGNGILNPTRAHRTGRASEVQWAYDHSQGSTTMYVAGTNGGLWKYSLGLGKWLPISDRLQGSPSVGAFWVDPDDSQHMLIGTGDPWRNGGSGLYETQDGGYSWTLESIGSTPGSFYKIASDRSDSRIILAASRDGLLRSTDGGLSWQRVITTEVTDVVQDPVYHSYWYAAGPGFGVRESFNRGASFHNFATGFPTDVSRVSLAVSESAPNHVFALAASTNLSNMKGIYRSSNYGFNWQAIKSQDDLSWGQAFHTTAIAVDPTDPNNLLVGMGGFQINRNATRSSAPNSWVIGIEIGHADCTSFAFTPDGRYALASNDGGVYSLDVQNETWVDHLNLIPDLNLQEIVVDGSGSPRGSFHQARSKPWLALAGLQDNGVVALDTDLDTVDYLTAGDGGGVHISNHDPMDMLATSGGPPYSRVRSTDGGATWSGVDCGLTSQPSAFTVLEDPVARWPNRSYTHQGGTIYSGFLWWSCGWSRVNSSSPAGFTIETLDMATRSNAWVFYTAGTGTDPYGSRLDGNVYVFDSTVHGTLGQMGFSNRTPPLPFGSQRLDARVTADRHESRPDTVYYTTGRSRPSRAFVSHDRGLSWQNVTGNLTSLLPSADYWEVVALPNDPETLFLATDVGVYSTTDGGQNWARMSSFLPLVVEVTDLEVSESTSGRGELLIATKGRGFYRTTIY